MSVQTAIGRFYQLNPAALKADRVSEIRCNRGCRLATIVEIDGKRAMIVHAHLTNQAGPDGVNATAKGVRPRAGVLAEIQSMTGTEAWQALAAGTLTEEQLEGLHREHGDPRQISYLATAADAEQVNSWTFTRCKHLAGYLSTEHYRHDSRKPLIVRDLPRTTP